MRAAEFAALLHGRRSGPRKWMARCPTHRDRHPSLSIREGSDGRVLVHCFVGCDTADVLAAMGLTWRSLYSGPSPSPEQARLIGQERKAEEEERRDRHAAHAAAAERLRRREAICAEYGARLARNPSNDDLARQFHSTLDKLRRDEETEGALRS